MLPSDPDPEVGAAPNPEQLWEEILSEDAAQVLPALRTMGVEERAAILAHLRRMAHETGWSDGQARRARAALAMAAGDPHLASASPDV
jgi:hypothetical protein